MTDTILIGDVRERLAELPDGSVHCVVTSPPYWGLRDYGTAKWEGGDAECDHTMPATGATQNKGNNGKQAQPFKTVCGKCGARRIDAQLGLEATIDEYIANMVAVFREVRRVLRDDGTLWLNMGDGYASAWPAPNTRRNIIDNPMSGGKRGPQRQSKLSGGLKEKDLIGQPWRLAFALQADDWYLRSDIIWCLSGGTKVHAKTQKGEMPTTIKDLVRLDPATVKLWNGEEWTQVLGWNESERGAPLEIELRSGERIGCTVGHQWPTQRGNVRADTLRLGDVIDATNLPEPTTPHRPTHIDEGMAWLLGLYLAEGSQSGGRLQFAGHADEAAWRVEQLIKIVEPFGGTVRAHTGGTNVVVDCPPVAAIVDQYINGRNA